jgi:molybdopterin converting factor small subunit
MVQVKLMSPQLREQHGARRIELEASDVEEVLSRLEVEQNQDLRVLVNGRAIQFLAGRDTPLDPEDAVTLYYVGIRGWPGG